MEECLVREYSFTGLLPFVVCLSGFKGGVGKEYWNDATSEGGWNPVFTRPFNDWEVDEAKRLLCGLGRYTLEDEVVDKVRWKLMNTGIFTVKSMYKALQLSTFESFPW